MATHKYHRATDFYESSIRELEKTASSSSSSAQPSDSDLVYLSHDLAKLYIKLGRADNAIRVLKNVLHDPAMDLTALRQDVTTLLLIAQVLQSNSSSSGGGGGGGGGGADNNSNNSSSEVFSVLERTYSNQKEIVRKLRSSTSGAASAETIEKEKGVLSDIAEHLGRAVQSSSRSNGSSSNSSSNSDRQSEEFFLEAIQHNPQNTKAMFGLSKVMLARGEKEQCQNQCIKILTAAPETEDAAILLSEVLFDATTDDPIIAVKPLQDLLAIHPNNYNALEKAVTLLRRAGQLSQALPLLAAAKASDRRCSTHPGFNYCQGLYSRFTNDIVRAISSFNLARKDDKWGAPALTHMVELYLNPDQEGAWEEKESGPLDDATRAHIAAAEELLKELRPKSE